MFDCYFAVFKARKLNGVFLLAIISFMQKYKRSKEIHEIYVINRRSFAVTVNKMGIFPCGMFALSGALKWRANEGRTKFT